MLDRSEFNRHVLEETLELLKSDEIKDLTEALINTCYLVEQSIKKYLRSKNPLLYYDAKELIDPQKKAEAFLDDPSCTLHTINLDHAIKIFVQLHPNKKLSLLLDELRLARNDIMHSTNLQIKTPLNYADLNAKILIELMELIKDCCSMEYANVIVQTRKDLVKRQKELLEKAEKEFQEELKKHQTIYNSLGQEEIKLRKLTKTTFQDSNTFISDDKVHSCPACGEETLEQISMVDFDYSDGEVVPYGSTFYRCKVCDLELSESRFEMYTNEGEE